MEVTKKQIQEITDNVEMGYACFLHKKTGEIESYPDNLDLMHDEENPFQETIDKVEDDFENYIEFGPMPSREAYQVMLDFKDTVNDERMLGKIELALEWKKPFSNFKNLIETSEYRQAWFDFKRAENEKWVLKQLKIEGYEL